MKKTLCAALAALTLVGFNPAFAAPAATGAGTGTITTGGVATGAIGAATVASVAAVAGLAALAVTAANDNGDGSKSGTGTTTTTVTR